jgi:hypothetical protein
VTDPSYAQRLLALDQAQFQGKALSESDEAFLYTVLNADAVSEALRIRASLILTGEEGAVLDRLLAAFPTLPLRVQKVLVPFLCGLEIYPPYAMLLQFLKSTLSESMADWIILALSRSKYPLAIPVIAHVADPDVLFHRRIKRLLAQLGLKKLGPYLAMMPEVPHAHVYEEVFGDLAFRRLRARRS